MAKRRIALMCLCLILLAFAVSVAFTAANAAVVKQGSSGATVKKIQTKLKNWGYYTGAVDGVYGAKTKAAVQYFQRRNGLTADGVVGKATAAAMGITLSSSSSSTSTSSATSKSGNGDLYLMACCIYGEARGESYQGKVAVGAVILNRVKHASFPSSVSGVIYQKGAFTCVSDGQINLGTNDECMRAAQDAFNGWDPTGGAIYYYNPKTATSKWIWSRPVLTTIGKHVFCS